MVGFQSESTCSAYPEDSVIVVLDANRNKGSVDALDWAIKHIVQPKDTVVVLGLLSEVGKRPSNSCFPIQMGIGFSGICKSFFLISVFLQVFLKKLNFFFILNLDGK